jgi:hypothetical protein
VLLGLVEEKASLEDIFVRLTTQEAGTAAASTPETGQPAPEEVVS